MSSCPLSSTPFDTTAPQFNLETPDPELFKDHTRIYRSISTSPSVPLFQLQVLLCIPELATNQVLVYTAPDSSRVRIDPTPRFIVLEAWDLEFVPNRAGSQYSDDRTDVAPSTIYKHGIPLFRSIFTLLRVLPAWKLARRLRRRVGGSRNGNFSIHLRVDSVDGSIRSDEVMTFGESLVHLCPLRPSRARAREQWPLNEASKTRYHPRVCGISTEEREACIAPYHAPHGRAGSLSDIPAAPQLPARHEGVAAVLAVPLRGSRLHADSGEEPAARQHIGLARELSPAHFAAPFPTTISC